jgi:hypothetical protein
MKKANIYDVEIDTAFKGTDFGSANKLKLLEQGVLKRIAGYHCGHTLTQIMIELGLITKKRNVTRKGKEFLFTAFYDHKHSG